MSADYRKLLEGGDFCCVIDVVGWRPIGDHRGWMNIGVISNHYHYDYRSLRARLRRAWEALRGADGPWLEFHDRREVEPVVAAMREAADVAFG
jgi:hypothetical protein